MTGVSAGEVAQSAPSTQGVFEPVRRDRLVATAAPAPGTAGRLSVDVAATGMTGYCGATVVGRLLEAGLSVRLLTRHRDSVRCLGRHAAHPRLEVMWVPEGGVDSGTLRTLFQGARLRIHGAALASPAWVAADPEAARRINLDLTRDVAAVLRACDPWAPTLFLSSLSVYGGNKGPCNADTPPQPNTEYGWQKLECETMMRFALPALTIVRPGTCTGTAPVFENEGRRAFRDDLFINHAVKVAVSQAQGLAAEPMLCRGAGQWRPYVHVDDLGRLIVHWALRALAGARAQPGGINAVPPSGNLTKFMVAQAVSQHVAPLNVEFDEAVDEADPRDCSVASQLGEHGFEFIHDDVGLWVRELSRYYRAGP
jgi:nucleoside-diphosphate-sugar epimerase